jgi:hypothetical protein
MRARFIGARRGITPSVVASELPHTTAALAPQTGDRMERLGTVYRSNVKAAADGAIHDKRFKMQDFVSPIDVRIWPAPEAGQFGTNAPEDWRLETEAL